jgi:VWFA-related protein
MNVDSILRSTHNLADYPCSRRQWVLWAASLFCARTLLAAPHDEQDLPTFSTDVKVVSLLATVRNKNGAIVRDLSKDDFTLLENGRPQTIRYFSRESDLPLTLGLMVDTSMSQRRVLDAERGASFRFLDQVLRENKDQVFIMQFDMSVQLRQPLTSSRKALNDTLPYVDTPTNRQLQIQTGGGTLLYDAVVTAAQDVTQKARNRKALIVLSDGVDIGSEATLAQSIAAAQRADTLIYSILFSDPGAYGLSFAGSTGRSALMRMSRETGGDFFEVSKKQSIDQIFDRIQEELRSQYSMGYVSDDPVRISEFRKIQLIARTKGLLVQTREQYWAQR